MHQSKLLALLKSISPSEIHWVQKFLNSPFYNTHPLPIALFQYLIRYHPDFTSPRLKKEVVFKKLFPKESYDAQKMRKTMYSLAVLIEEFLVAMRLRKKQEQKEQLLLDELGGRNLYGPFARRVQNKLKQLEALPYRNIDVYKMMLELHLNYYGHIETMKQKHQASVLSSAKTYLDFYYLLENQRLQIALEGNKKIFGHELSIPTLAQSKLALQNIPSFKLYQLIKKAMTIQENTAIYDKIERLFKKEINRLGRNDQLEIIRMILNHFSSQINHGRKGFHAKMLSLYKFGLAKDLMIENDLISENTFTNIVTVGLFEKEFGWVEQFIDNYTNFLPDTIREDAICLSKSLLFFNKKDYAVSTELLLTHSFLNALYLLNAKTILLRTYFEQFVMDQSYYDLLLDQCYAFDRFVRRNAHISKKRKALYLNFIAFTRKIANAFLMESPMDDLAKQVKEASSVALKSWLLEKVGTKINR